MLSKNILLGILLSATLFSACTIEPRPVQEKKPKGTDGHKPHKVAPPLPLEEQPRALAASYCTCQEEIFTKYSKKIDLITATPVAQLTQDQVVATFKDVKGINERFLSELKHCGEEISHHAYFQQVTSDEALSVQFGNEMEACMTVLEKNFAPKLEVWNRYLDAIGKAQHEQLEKYQLELHRREGK
ncbi:MAG: hypothetical protein KF690_04560 [Bacteroidetes bacterium]|nr:hypothetical protein [Bacteroidota bacterium]